ncbi:hypothetical protein BN1708_003271 [Verticillium longisporum]|uniref:Uncharacterized protein n=1 Tax=Verticillium longisporum TaxID=100787 RepID=A0A0G4LD83_VERLO|nr:hypothetical protein BN1708_003271 [Verticillium longisporum]
MVFASLVAGAKRLALGTGGATPMLDLFPKTDPAVDGDECSHDCESCHIKYPRGFKIETEDALYGVQKGFSTHLLVATGKTDWVREIEDEEGSVMEAIGKAAARSNGGGFEVASKKIREAMKLRRRKSGDVRKIEIGDDSSEEDEDDEYTEARKKT